MTIVKDGIDVTEQVLRDFGDKPSNRSLIERPKVHHSACVSSRLEQHSGGDNECHDEHDNRWRGGDIDVAAIVAKCSIQPTESSPQQAGESQAAGAIRRCCDSGCACHFIIPDRKDFQAESAVQQTSTGHVQTSSTLNASSPQATESPDVVQRVAKAIHNAGESDPYYQWHQLSHDNPDAALAEKQAQAAIAAMRTSEIPYNKAVNRATEMLHVAARHCEQYADDAETFYDDTNCDGSCIADDCRSAADELKYQFARTTEPVSRNQDMGEPSGGSTLTPKDAETSGVEAAPTASPATEQPVECYEAPFRRADHIEAMSDIIRRCKRTMDKTVGLPWVTLDQVSRIASRQLLLMKTPMVDE